MVCWRGCLCILVFFLFSANPAFSQGSYAEKSSIQLLEEAIKILEKQSVSSLQAAKARDLVGRVFPLHDWAVAGSESDRMIMSRGDDLSKLLNRYKTVIKLEHQRSLRRIACRGMCHTVVKNGANASRIGLIGIGLGVALEIITNSSDLQAGEKRVFGSGYGAIFGRAGCDIEHLEYLQSTVSMTKVLSNTNCSKHSKYFLWFI